MANDKFGIYIHIPYCLQICSYCDFTKYELGKTLPPERYIELLAAEIRQRGQEFSSHLPVRPPGGVADGEVDTIYFGGGTPSLLRPDLILSVLNELAKVGLRSSTRTEISLEIDPATVDQGKLDSYLAMGVNRFSVGAQSFNDRHLRFSGRKHTSKDVVETLSLLKSNRVNYSFDLLFALPSQSLEEVRADVATALAFDPSHLSAYCLTVPEGHRMSANRAPDDEQVNMFHVIETTLATAGIRRYEISNFAKPGYESRHNMLYWTDQPYWGIGLSSHSYLPQEYLTWPDQDTRWGTRFWNPRAMKKYEGQLTTLKSLRTLPDDQVERLKQHQAVTDFCHTSLRLVRGLDENALRLKFGEATTSLVKQRLEALLNSGLVEKTSSGWTLSSSGLVLANSVFGELTFLESELIV